MSRTVNEERGPYDPNHDEHDGADGVERIGDILHRLMNERGWPLTVGVTRANGHNPDATDDPSHGDV